MDIELRRSDRLLSEYPEMAFGRVLATGVDIDLMKETFELAAAETQSSLATGLDTALTPRIKSFEEFFQLRGQSFPLTSQIKSASKRGFPPVPAQVLSLLVAETATGVLMGVQDAKKVDTFVELDLLDSTDEFPGMRDVVRCSPGEIVVRDRQSIVASYYQGPDKRTAVTPASSDLLYYAFSTPSRPDMVHTALDWIMSRLELCSNEVSATTDPDPLPV